MICTACATQNEDGRKFCKECAAPLAMTCPSCGSGNAPDAKFCGECATALSHAATGAAAPPGPSRSAPVAERRLVTVLFADLVGFTPFSEGRDPEEVREMLSHWFELGSEIVVRHGGTVEKFIGDAVMAVWGTPVAHEDDAERAVRAALEVIDAVRAIGEGIQARAGVLTGEAAVTLGAANEGLVAGDMVNTAARLQSVAPPGSVLAGESTFRAASRAIAFEEAGDQVLKGKAAPVPAWRAVRVVAERGGRNQTEALEPPFVGREDELRLVKDLLHATGRERRVRLVSIMGPAGIGKSRLSREFSRYVDGLIEDIYYHVGRCPAYGEGITFWALGEMVRGRCGLLEADDEATTRQKVAETVARWVPDEADRAWIEPALLTLLGVEAGATPHQLFAAWRTFFERIALEGPVTLVFEDFHFADSGLLDFVEHLLDWSRGAPIYVITLSRPEILERRPGWGSGKRNFVSLVLEPLPDSIMRTLVGAMVQGLPDRAAAAIVERADGIPLYAVETVRMLLADGRLVDQDGTLVPAGDLSQLAVPETLIALIGARLDALDQSDRALMQDASVLGQSFALQALAAITGREPAEVEKRLDVLVRRELVSREMDPRSPEHGQYAFVQALIREVAYSTLARRDRKARHLASARYFESMGSDELASVLAGHYLAAHLNAGDGPEADALAAQARVALRAAAERAASLGAHDQEIRFLEQALEVTAEPAEQADLLERAGVAGRKAAQYERAEQLLRRAVELRRTLGDPALTAHAVMLLVKALAHGFRSDAAVELGEAALAEFVDLAGYEVVAELESIVARAHLDQNHEVRALEMAERVLEHAEQREHLTAAAQAMMGKGGALATRGRKREGIALIKAGGELAAEIGQVELRLASLVQAGFHLGDVDPVAAFDHYQEVYQLALRTGNRGALLRSASNLGYTRFLEGTWDEGLALMTEYLEEDLDDLDRISLLANSLIIRVCRGEDVSEPMAEAEAIAQRQTGRGWAVPLLDTQANKALADGRPDAARQAWLELVELDPQASEFTYRAARSAIWARDLATLRDDLGSLEDLGIHGRTADVRLETLKAAVAALEGNVVEAKRRYREAMITWRDTNQAWDEALTAIDMATLLDPGDPEVVRAAEAARKFLERVGARPFLERLDAELARQHRPDDRRQPAPQPSAEVPQG